MIDIHSHILYGVDDGSETFEKSILIINEAIKIGITDVVLTPHYINETSFNKTYKQNVLKFNKLLEYVKKNKLPINLYLGNEIFIDSDIIKLISDKKAITLNKSKYLLFELPRMNKVNNLKEIIFNIQSNNFIPVLAHPERYKLFLDDYKLMDELIEIGVLFQGNIGSLMGYYGSNAKKLIVKMLKNKQIHFLASDVHKPGSLIYQNMNIIKKRLSSVVNKEYSDDLLINNPRIIINNKNLDISKYKTKKSILEKIFKK